MCLSSHLILAAWITWIGLMSSLLWSLVRLFVDVVVVIADFVQYENHSLLASSSLQFQLVTQTVLLNAVVVLLQGVKSVA